MAILRRRNDIQRHHCVVDRELRLKSKVHCDSDVSAESSESRARIEPGKGRIETIASDISHSAKGSRQLSPVEISGRLEYYKVTV